MSRVFRVNLDQTYPALSALAQTKRRTLNGIAQSADQTSTNYLRLEDCCDMVQRGMPRWSHADAYNYLATIDEFVRRLPPRLNDSVWHRLNGPESQFLDTVVEATWALFFGDNDIPVELEKKFDPSNPNLGDADFCVPDGGVSLWLDAMSVCFPRRPTTQDSLIAELAKRAKRKYREKFTSAGVSTRLTGSSVGILMCVLKREPSVFPLLLSSLSEGFEFAAPPALFDDRKPLLKLICIHTLCADRSSELLRPAPIIKWTRSKNSARKPQVEIAGQ
jgi:hypothetical protein